jgi:D-alanyl-D-alanine carboxypeptidase
LRLVDQERLALDDLAAQYLPKELRENLPGMDQITIEHLLRMRSGLPDYIEAGYIQDNSAPEYPAIHALSHIYGEPLDFAPGTNESYYTDSSTDYLFLGLVLEYVHGERYASIIENEVFRPAGLKDSFVFDGRRLPLDFPYGHEGNLHIRAHYLRAGFGDLGVIASARDLVRLYRAVFEEGNLLSEPIVEKLLSTPENKYGEITEYGMGVEVDRSLGGSNWLLIGHTGYYMGFSSELRMNFGTSTIAVHLRAADGVDSTGGAWSWDTILVEE